MASQLSILSEIARKLRPLSCICDNTGSALVKDYQPLDCNGDPVGTPIDVMATISVAKQDVSLCNSIEVATAINGEYNVPILETGFDGWILSSNNDISKVHSISISFTGTSGSADLTIDGGAPVTCPIGYSYNLTVSTVLNVEYELGNFTGDCIPLISGSKSV